jgi:hypothetical protein
MWPDNLCLKLGVVREVLDVVAELMTETAPVRVVSFSERNSARSAWSSGVSLPAGRAGVKRSAGDDGWTRELELDIPVADPTWLGLRPDFEGTSANRQIDLGMELRRAYPDNVDQQRTWVTFRRSTASQARPLPSARENTTRSRSFYFIAAGLARAAVLGPTIPLHVPENDVLESAREHERPAAAVQAGQGVAAFSR